MSERLKPCQHCGEAWIYESEDYGFKVNCVCGHAWKSMSWHKTKTAAVRAWNKIADRW